MIGKLKKRIFNVRKINGVIYLRNKTFWIAKKISFSHLLKCNIRNQYLDIKIVDFIEGLPVTQLHINLLGKNNFFIGGKWFYRARLKKIELPSTLQKITAYAFTNCESLEEVSLNEGLIGIERGAFRKCPKLSKINIPDSVEFIERETFQVCPALKTLEVGGTTDIDSSAVWANTTVYWGREKGDTLRYLFYLSNFVFVGKNENTYDSNKRISDFYFCDLDLSEEIL